MAKIASIIEEILDMMDTIATISVNFSPDFYFLIRSLLQNFFTP